MNFIKTLVWNLLVGVSVGVITIGVNNYDGMLQLVITIPGFFGLVTGIRLAIEWTIAEKHSNRSVTQVTGN